MDNSLNLNLKTEQTLSPQMLQSLALLPMPILELKAHIQQQIESNPALEIPESDFVENTQSDEYEEDDYSDNNYDPEASERKQQAMENSALNGESLTEHLLKQLGEIDIPQEMYDIGEMLIGNLDANGFFIVPLETLFENSDYTEEQINRAVSIVQTFDPYGICVKDFRESLIVQAKCSSMAQEDLEVFSKLVLEHLEDIQSGNLNQVAFKLHIYKEDLETFINILKSFTPYPGQSFSNQNTEFIVPEFSIRNIDGNLVLKMNDSSLPELEISKEFAELSKKAVGPQAKETATYINDCIRQAKTLISQIDLRKNTMTKAAKVLCEKQADFFFNGPSALKPLTLKDVAQAIQVHETTVSRLSQSKWVETDYGILPMKYFFTQGVNSSDGEQTISRTAVKDIIAGIIKEKGNISDQKISDILLEQNIKCARRTVSKYRKELNIDSSFKR